MLSIYTSLPHWNTQCMFDFGKACASVIWRQYFVNCMASRSPPRQFNWVDFILLISWQLFWVFSPPVWFMLRFWFSALRNTETFTGFFPFSSLSRLYFANKQSPVDATINLCWVTVRLHGNFLSNWSIWCFWNSGPFINQCQFQEIIHQVNYSQINQLCSIIELCLWTVFHCMLFIMHSFCCHSNAMQQLSKFHVLHPEEHTQTKKRVG